MASASPMVVCPRSTGEVLDDAWRLVLADAPLLLALTSLFHVPAATLCLLLLTWPRPTAGWASVGLPALTALTLPLTGLASGACQEAFRCRAAGEAPRLACCLAGALRQGLQHMTARALVVLGLAVCFAGLLLYLFLLRKLSDEGSSSLSPVIWLLLALLWAGGVVWLSSTVHAIIAAGEKGCFGALLAASREMQRQPGKAAAVAFTRPLLLLFAMLNLHLFLRGGLWVADELAGFDLALPALMLTPTNPVYALALGLLAWLLLAPYAEACNYLLHVDARARYEGLDLWYRARQLFPTLDRQRGVAVLAIAAWLLVVPTARADGRRLDIIRAVRKDLAQITLRVQTAEPYRGTDWQGPLDDLARRLAREGGTAPNRFRWFDRSIVGFDRLNRTAALDRLAELDRRLALLQEGLVAEKPPEDGTGPTRADQIRSLLPPDPEAGAAKEKTKPPLEKARRPVPRDENVRPVEREARPGLVGPHSFGGLSELLLVLLVGLLLAAAMFVALQLRAWRGQRGPQRSPIDIPTRALEDALEQAERYTVEGMWRQADDLARAGRFLDAVRTLYLAVLALLHRANFIRYERTRTNGEYLLQLRARTAVHRPFQGLTRLFEVKWYGERCCYAEEFAECRSLADEVRRRALEQAE